MVRKHKNKPLNQDILLNTIGRYTQGISRRDLAKALSLKGVEARNWLKQTLKDLAREEKVIIHSKKNIRLPTPATKETVAAVATTTTKPVAKPFIGLIRIEDKQAYIIPVDRKMRDRYVVSGTDLKDGQFVQYVPEQKLGRGRYKQATIIKVLPTPELRYEGSFTEIALHEHHIPHSFPKDVILEAKRVAKAPIILGNRHDLREMPLITIDGIDARDFDDAVYASQKSKHLWEIIVAIADVASYVTSGGVIDKEAQLRGNSVYFPDQVVPMLPFALSNDVCSLVPDQDRYCFAVKLTINQEGVLKEHTFFRGLMRSHARLTYEEVQTIYDSQNKAHPRFNEIHNLYQVYHILKQAREARGALELELPEQKIILDEKGVVQDVTAKHRLPAHELIEECMILANIAAGKTLEKQKIKGVYRIHDKPNAEKVTALKETLKGLKVPSQKLKGAFPHEFNEVLAAARHSGNFHLVQDLVLRSQSQAQYNTDNIGHFGLGLTHYAHFTSPIRRYADLLVHRALITALKLGDDGYKPGDIDQLGEWAQHISQTERRADMAERDTKLRFATEFLQRKLGNTFQARISGVTSFGLFLNIEPYQIDGFIPIRSLGNEYFYYDQVHHTLSGERSHTQYRLGSHITVQLEQATPLTGSLLFSIIQEGNALPSKKSKRSRPQKRHRR